MDSNPIKSLTNYKIVNATGDSIKILDAKGGVKGIYQPVSPYRAMKSSAGIIGMPKVSPDDVLVVTRGVAMALVEQGRPCRVASPGGAVRDDQGNLLGHLDLVFH